MDNFVSTMFYRAFLLPVVGMFFFSCTGDTGPAGPSGKDGKDGTGSTDKVIWLQLPDNGKGEALDTGFTNLPLATFDFDRRDYPSVDSIAMQYIITASDSVSYVELYNLSDNKVVEGSRVFIPGRFFGGTPAKITTPIVTTANLYNSLPDKQVRIYPRMYRADNNPVEFSVRDGRLFLYRRK